MKKTSRELRKFALVMALAFAFVTLLLWWKGRPSAQITASVSLFFIVFGLLFPKLLSPIEWVWMKFAHFIGVIMTFIILSLTFFVVITPFGLIMRLFKKDLLSLKFDKSIKSYWCPVDPQGPTSRPEKPY